MVVILVATTFILLISISLLREQLAKKKATRLAIEKASLSTPIQSFNKNKSYLSDERGINTATDEKAKSISRNNNL